MTKVPQTHGGNKMKLELLKNIKLKSGATSANDHEMCVMEAVAYVAGEPWSDRPKCASKVIAAFCRSWNDSMDDATRQRLKPYVPKLIGTADGEATEQRLAWMVTDWLARVQAPAWFDLSEKLKPYAAKLRALPELTSKTAAKAHPMLTEARNAGAAAWDAARDAARAAARDAARAAAWDAARAAQKEKLLEILTAGVWPAEAI